MLGGNNNRECAIGFSFITLLLIGNIVNATEIDMSEVKALAKLSVNSILKNSPVKEINQNAYWDIVMKSPKPVVVMFYSNEDKHSQNLSTLVRYVTIDYSDKILFCSFMVAKRGQPDSSTESKMKQQYSLDKTPGILFYDNDTGKMILEHEQYGAPRFKEYRTPSMLLWKLYYVKVEHIIASKVLD